MAIGVARLHIACGRYYTRTESTREISGLLYNSVPALTAGRMKLKLSVVVLICDLIFHVIASALL